MELFKQILLVLMSLLTVIRYLLNTKIYRDEYDYYKYTDMVAIDFSEEEVKKRDNAAILFFLSLFTFLWVNFKKENKKLARYINVSSLFFFLLLIIYFVVRSA